LVAAIRAGSASTPLLLGAIDPVESSRNNRFAVAVYALSCVNVNAITTNGTITRPCNTHSLCNRTIRNNASNGEDSPTDTSGGPVSCCATGGAGRPRRRRGERSSSGRVRDCGAGILVLYRRAERRTRGALLPSGDSILPRNLQSSEEC
jgi:hypothetical protein